ncbi:hypothetical protein FOZ63_024641 [Perkinsus olseni]|uniref:RING-type domain-containing protein n=1 Tax=Perkinsus olseni TaxID=32597 RepID=A0A7J6RES8_PEROL|nr:hypothetical protein FOZ63_024641 [Perkinsus olseni]
MRAPEPTDDAEMKSDGTDVATADEPEGEEPTEKCVICNKPGDLGVRFPCGCPSHKKCLESSVENGVRNGQAPAEIECPEHTGRRLGVSFLESTVPAALEPVRSVWSGFSSRVAAVAAAANSNSNAGTVKPGPKAVRSGDRVDVAAKSEAHKAEPARTVTPSAPVNAPWSARAARCDACRDPLLTAQGLRLPCRHRFHRHCLGQALTRQISHDRGDGLQCPVCRESVAIEANDALLKSCLDPGVYYKLHSSRAPQRAVAEPASSRPSRSPDTARGSAEDKHALRQKFQHGWRPCPKGCRFLGNFPSSSDAEFITCSCGYRYCRGCGVDENIIAAHDGRWHKPSCSYFKHYSSFKAAPRASSKCPQCTELHHRCPFPMNDGYPDRLMRSLLNDDARLGTEARRPAPWARN